jgi:hypothetical protein
MTTLIASINVPGSIERAITRFDADAELDELIDEALGVSSEVFDGPVLLLQDKVLGRRRWRREV